MDVRVALRQRDVEIEGCDAPGLVMRDLLECGALRPGQDLTFGNIQGQFSPGPLRRGWQPNADLIACRITSLARDDYWQSLRPPVRQNNDCLGIPIPCLNFSPGSVCQPEQLVSFECIHGQAVKKLSSA